MNKNASSTVEVAALCGSSFLSWWGQSIPVAVARDYSQLANILNS